jgi:hypothetical protein
MSHRKPGGANVQHVHSDVMTASPRHSSVVSRTRFCLAVICLSGAAELSAQPSGPARAGFQAIILTSVGAFPQTLRVPSPDGTMPRFSAEFLYGAYRFRNSNVRFDNIGFGASIRAAPRLNLGFTLGQRDCEGCEGLRMADANVHVDLWNQKSDEPGEGRMSVAIQVNAGIGQPNESHFNARSLAAGLPLAVTLPQHNGSDLTLFFKPIIAYGYLNDGSGTVLGRTGGDGSVRLVVGAGVTYALVAGFAAHAGLHRIVVEDAPTQFGFGASYAFGRRVR